VIFGTKSEKWIKNVIQKMDYPGDFIKISGLSSVAFLVYPGIINSNEKQDGALFMDQHLPVIEKSDVLIA
jgi:hypothetical protein